MKAGTLEDLVGSGSSKSGSSSSNQSSGNSNDTSHEDGQVAQTEEMEQEEEVSEYGEKFDTGMVVVLLWNNSEVGNPDALWGNIVGGAVFSSFSSSFHIL